ncbi:hypothetical protein CBOM_04483 [Ceraceosorus bombacis]|uniref:Acyltransferase 3 domain-containing protein n=1 Tax=Ceraceosorus bombacis TaxID=401625 RepID=A0A0P1BPA7_9BASI|nr:hypothetical protein CBOM_04483 [Ceraceosorus bombacis]
MSAFVSLVCLSWLPVFAYARCECGFHDVATGSLWTDALISYFNESDGSTLDPVDKNGQFLGTSTDGALWSSVENLNEWEDGYTATFRSGSHASNAYMTTNASPDALALEVQPALLKERISYGAQIRSQRQDILFGSFTTALRFNELAAGTAFEMNLHRNVSSTISTMLTTGDQPLNATLRWDMAGPSLHGFSALRQNFTDIDLVPGKVHQHRIAWLPGEVSWSFDASNSMPGFFARREPEWKRGTLPHAPTALSFRHYSNGEQSVSMGPPLSESSIAYIIFVRAFFNSSLPERGVSFEKRCSRAQGGISPVCSTEDLTLRSSDSTPFPLAALKPIDIASPSPSAKQWSADLLIVLASLFALVLGHAFVHRALKHRRAVLMNRIRNSSAQKPGPTTSGVAADPFLGHVENDQTRQQEKRLTGTVADWDDLSLFERQIAFVIGEEKNDPGTPRICSCNRDPFADVGHADVGTSSLANAEDIRGSTVTLFSRSLELQRLATPEPSPSSPQLSTKASTLELMSPRRSHSCVSILDLYPSLRLIEWSEEGHVEAQDFQASCAEGGLASGRPQHDEALAPIVPRSVLKAVKGHLHNMMFTPGATRTTASGARRVDYLDGLRGMACLLVATHHWLLIFCYSFAAWTPSTPAQYPKMAELFYKIAGPIVANGDLNVGIFFMLASRVMVARFQVKKSPADLAEAIFRRAPRLMVPITAAMTFSYLLSDCGAFVWMRRLPSRTWSSWSYLAPYDSIGQFLNTYLLLWFTAPGDVPVATSTYATGILWTTPVIVSCSWTTFLCALVANSIPNHVKRIAFYVVCFIVSWWAARWDYFFIAGLMLSDLDNRLKYREKRFMGLRSRLAARFGFREGRIRIPAQAIGWIFFTTGAALAWWSAAADKQIYRDKEHLIHPDLDAARASQAGPPYYEPSLDSFFFALGFFLLCDLCDAFRIAFTLRPWSILGRNAFSLYLIHGQVYWSYSAFVHLHLLKAGLDYWAAALINWASSMVLLLVLCECFTRTFDAWGISLSRALWRVASGNVGRRI